MQSKMGLPLAENGIFPSLTSPEVGVTPKNFALRARYFHHPPFLFPGSAPEYSRKTVGV